MPPAWRVRVIEAALEQAGLPGTVAECDIYALPAVLRTVAVDTIIAEGAGFPMVAVRGEIVSFGAIDLDAIVLAVRGEHRAGDR